jgi:ABC-2 type transport system ATP-binding protein
MPPPADPHRPTAPLPGVPGTAEAAAAGPPIVAAEGLTLRYGARTALEGVSLAVWPGELFALLGPNGSGKSTLLRILTTLLRPAAGRATVDGLDVALRPAAVRHRLGVVFQAPGLDAQLTVAENLRFHGYLYHLSGAELARRSAALLERFGLAGRRRERVGTLSGGLQRRVGLAKALLHRPALLLLDEPSSGLDLAAQQAFWRLLDELRAEQRLTIVLATHLMDEAERSDRVALLDLGRLVALDTPAALKRALGDIVIGLETPHPEALAPRLRERLGIAARVEGRALRLPAGSDPALAPRLLAEFGEEITAVHLGRPTLEDVFLAHTGHSILAGQDDAPRGNTP